MRVPEMRQGFARFAQAEGAVAGQGALAEHVATRAGAVHARAHQGREGDGGLSAILNLARHRDGHGPPASARVLLRMYRRV